MYLNTKPRNKSTDIYLAIGGLGLLVFGVIFLVVSLPNSHWTRVAGRVTNYKVVQTTSQRGGSYYDTTIQYDVAGRTYTITQTESFQPKVGSMQTVAYDPAAPSHAKSLNSQPFMAYVVMVMGVGLMLYAAFDHIRHRQP